MYGAFLLFWVDGGAPCAMRRNLNKYSAFWCFDVGKCQYDYFRYNKPAI